MARPWFLFAHGAGAPSSSPWMRRWSESLSALGEVTPFDYPYMLRGRRHPDPLPKLIEAHREALTSRPGAAAGPTVLIGKSMGGRVGCHLSLEEPVGAVVCLGYPLRAAGKAGKVRDEVLLSMTAPVMFVQGTRDPLCPLELLETVRSQMKAPNELYVVDSGNHSLEATKTSLKTTGSTQADVDRAALGAIRAFLEKALGIVLPNIE